MNDNWLNEGFIDCTVARFEADLQVTMDDAVVDVLEPPLPLSRVTLTGVAGTARLHTDREV